MGIAHANHVYSRRVPRRFPSSCDNLSLSRSKLFLVPLPSVVLPPPLPSSLSSLLLPLLLAPPPAVCPLGRRSRRDSMVMKDCTRKTCTGITKKQFFSFVKVNAKAAWCSVGIQRPPPPHPLNPDAVLQLFQKLEQEQAMEDMPGTHRLVSVLLRSSWPGRHRRIATIRELQLRSSPGPVRSQTAL